MRRSPLPEFSHIKETTEPRFPLPADFTSFQEQPAKLTRQIAGLIRRFFG